MQTVEDEPVGAVQQAVELLLAGQAGPIPDPDPATTGVTRAEIFQGVGTVIGALVRFLADNEGDRLELVAPIVRQLRRDVPVLPADVVAWVGGALVAAAVGDSPTFWRRAGRPYDRNELPVSPVEAYAWTVAAALLIELVDHLRGEGTAARLFADR